MQVWHLTYSLKATQFQRFSTIGQRKAYVESGDAGNLERKEQEEKGQVDILSTEHPL